MPSVIPVLSDRAICMCPHGGRLQFMVTHRMADGADGQVLTLPDYTSAMIVGCALPPVSGGPCMKVAFAQDPLGRAMTVRGQQVVTNTVIAFSDKGWPILVMHPGMSGVSIMYTPSIRLQRQAQFAQASVKKHQVGGSGDGAQATSSAVGSGPAPKPSSQTPWKDVTAAYWGSPYLRRGEAARLRGHTVGFGDGTAASFLVYRYDPDGGHAFVTRLSGSVAKNRAEAEWTFEYEGDVDDLPDMVDGDESYDPPEYYFELKVGGKSARSGLIEFVDSIEIELPEEDKETFADLDFVAHFADGTSLRGRFENGRVELRDIPPGKVHWELLPREKRIELVAWGQDIVHRDEQVALRAETVGFDDGTAATLKIFAYREEGDHELVGELAAAVERDRVAAVWPFAYHGDVADLPDPIGREGDVYVPIRYFFDIDVDGRVGRSGMLEFRDWMTIELVDGDGQPRAYEPFIARFTDGSERRFRLDGQGRARLDNIPPGRVYLEKPGSEEAHEPVPEPRLVLTRLGIEFEQRSVSSCQDVQRAGFTYKAKGTMHHYYKTASGEDTSTTVKGYRSTLAIEQPDGSVLEFDCIERANGFVHVPPGTYTATLTPRKSHPNNQEIHVVGNVFIHVSNHPCQLDGCIAPGTEEWDGYGVKHSAAALTQIIDALGGWEVGQQFEMIVRGTNNGRG